MKRTKLEFPIEIYVFDELREDLKTDKNLLINMRYAKGIHFLRFYRGYYWKRSFSENSNKFELNEFGILDLTKCL